MYVGADAPTGKVRYRTRTIHGTRTDAVRALHELVASVQAGPAFGADASVAVLMDTWLHSKHLPRDTRIGDPLVAVLYEDGGWPHEWPDPFRWLPFATARCDQFNLVNTICPSPCRRRAPIG